MPETVAILGASDQPDRYAHKAQRALVSKGHTAIPVNPSYDSIDGIKCYPTLSEIPGPVDTVTVYVKPEVLVNLVPEIIRVKPRRVILNPGTEDAAVSKALQDAGIEVKQACTLVLLSTDQF